MCPRISNYEEQFRIKYRAGTITLEDIEKMKELWYHKLCDRIDKEENK